MYLTTAARTLLARAPAARSASFIAGRSGSLISSLSSVSSTGAGSSSFPSLRSMSTMDTMETGTKTYMSLYPEDSTDGGIRLGNIVPDFAMDTTHGSFDSFHEWKKGKWAILFSHPADVSIIDETFCVLVLYYLYFDLDWVLTEFTCRYCFSVYTRLYHGDWSSSVKV